MQEQVRYHIVTIMKTSCRGSVWRQQQTVRLRISTVSESMETR